MSDEDECNECGIDFRTVARDIVFPSLCWHCAADVYGDEPRQTVCNGTCDSCDCDLWSTEEADS